MISYKPKGVCARKMQFEVEGDIITDLKIVGGCPGNVLGITNLVIGNNIDDIINRLEGIPCGFKKTSCPDQLAKALKEYKMSQGNNKETA